MPVETIIISVAASVGLKLLASALQKSPKQDFNEQLPDSAYRKSIPKTYNYFRQEVNWVEPFGEEEAFFKRSRGSNGFLGLGQKNKRDVLFGRFLGTVSNSQSDLIAMWIDGKGRFNAEITDPKALQAGINFIEGNVTWLDGSFEQQGWEYGNLKVANKPYYDSLKAQTSKDYDYGSTVGYRGISCIGFDNLDLSEDVKTSTLPTVSILNKTKITYNVSTIVLDICQDAGILPHEIDITEIAGIQCKGFSRPQNGQNYGEAIANLGLAYKFFATETNEGILSFRKFERPGTTLTLSLSDFIASEDGRLWSEIEEDPMDLPKTINFTFIDPGLEYVENSVISDEYPEARNQNEDGISVPVVMSEEEAKELANWHLNQVWVRSKSYKFSLAFSSLGTFVVGDILVLPNGEGVQVQNYTVGADYNLEVDAVRYDAKAKTTVANVNNTSFASTPASTANSSIDNTSFNPNGTINYGELKILDLPLADASHSELGIYCFSDRLNSVLYLDKGEGYIEELTFAEASTFGTCNTILGSVSNVNLKSNNLPILDPINTVTITLKSGQLFNSISDAAFAGQQRIAFIGRYSGNKWIGEYIGFQIADFVATNQYQLENLQRGLKGTHAYIDKHLAGEEFFLLIGEEAYWERTIFESNKISSTYNGKLQVVANQDLAITPVVTVPLIGQSLYPLPPLDVAIQSDPEGNLVFSFSSLYRGADRIAGEDNDSFELDLLKNGSVIRTLSGNKPLIYPQAQKVADNLNLNAIDGNIYKISSITGRGLQGLVRGLAVSGVSNTIVTNSSAESKGFKYISLDYTLTAADNGYWILVDTNAASVNINLPTTLSAIKLWVQNIGTKKVNLVGSLTATDVILRASEAIELRNRNAVWHGLLSGRLEIPQHLIVNTNFTLSQVHHNKIVSVESATTVTVTLNETLLTNPLEFHTTIRKKGIGDVFFQVSNSPTSKLESAGTILQSRYTAAYVGYEGNGVWIALGAFV